MAKKISGGTGANQHTKEQVVQNGPPADQGEKGTRAKIAQENKVGRTTVRRAEQFKKGVDVADSISPGLGKKIRSGETKVSKQTMEKLGKADQSTQKEVVQDIKEGKPEKAKKKLDPWSDKIELGEGDSYPTTTVFKKAGSDEIVNPCLQETYLNNIRDACTNLEKSIESFLCEDAKADVSSQSRSEAIIILNDIDRIIQKAKEQIQSTTKEKE